MWKKKDGLFDVPVGGHPPNVINHLTASIEKWLPNLSSEEKIFK